MDNSYLIHNAFSSGLISSNIAPSNESVHEDEIPHYLPGILAQDGHKFMQMGKTRVNTASWRRSTKPSLG